MTDQLLNEREIECFVSSWKLIPATGGVFDVWVNGELIFSKAAAGRHAELEDLRSGIMKALETIRPADFELAGD